MDIGSCSSLQDTVNSQGTFLVTGEVLGVMEEGSFQPDIVALVMTRWRSAAREKEQESSSPAMCVVGGG